MPAAHHLEIVENCHKRSYRPLSDGGDISSEVVGRLSAFAIPFRHPKGATLFAEGQPSRGVFILYSGRVKLFTSSANGRTFILRFAEPGEMLGLAGTLSGRPHETWAEAIQPTLANFVERRHLIRVMRHNCEFAVQVAAQLGETYYSALAEVRTLGHSCSANQKLATFLLDWRERNSLGSDRVGAPLTLTQEEISQVIGTSRETVSRLLSGFEKNGLIEWNGRNLVLRDRAALESLAAI